MAGANIKIGASSSEFQKQMKEVTNNLKLVSSACGVATEKANLFGNSQEKLKSVQTELTAKLQAQTQIVKLYQDRIIGINTEIDKQKLKQGELTNKIDEATKKYKDSVAATGKNSEESKKLKLEIQDLNEAFAKNEKAIESSNSKLISTTTKMNSAEKTVLKNKKALEDVNKEISNLKLDNLAKGFDTVSEKSGKVADALGKASLAIGAAGVAAGKMALDTENDLNTLQGKLGITGEEAEKLKAVAKGVYDNGFGESLGDSVEALTSLQQNLKSTKNWSDETKQSTLEQILTINKLFGTQTDELTKTLAVMQNSGLTDDINASLDVITVGFQNGANYSGELLDSLREYSPQFVKLGLDADEAMNYLITGANNGAFNLDKVGDAMKEFSIRAIDGSKTTQEGFQAIGLNADEMARKFSLGGESAKGAFSQVVQSLANMDNPLKQSQAGVNLFGTMWEDLGPQVILSLGSVKGGLEGVEDATAKAGEQINNSFSSQMTIAAREMKDSLIPLGTEVLNLAKVAMPPLKEILSQVTGFLKGMNDEQRQHVITGAGMVFAAAASFKGISVLTGGISDTIKRFKEMREFGGKAVEVIKDFSPKALDGAKAAGEFALSLGKSAVEFGKNAVQAGISAVQMAAHKVATIASTIVTNGMAAAQAALNFVMSLNPITLIIIGIAALIATIVVLWNKCDWFRNACLALFEVVGNTLKNIWQGVGGFISNTFNNVVAGIKGAWEGITAPFKRVVDSIGNMWQGIKSMFKLPHFTVTGSLNPLKWESQGMPRVGVDWYYKGGIFTTPTILGNIGVGDSFNGQGSKAEAVLPLSELWNELDKNFNKLAENLGGETIINIPIYLGDNEITRIAKVITPKVSTQLAAGVRRRK